MAATAASAKPKQAPRNEVDRLRAELRADFRSALRHAYLGPECVCFLTRLLLHITCQDAGFLYGTITSHL